MSEILFLERIVNRLESLIGLAKGNPLSKGELLKIDPQRTASFEFTVPSSWSDGWSIKIQPDNNFYTMMKTSSVSRLTRVFYKLETSDGSLLQEMQFSGGISSGILNIAAPIPDAFLPMSIVGEVFPAQGRKVTISVYLDNDPIASAGPPIVYTPTQRPITVSLSKGLPSIVRKTTRHSLTELDKSIAVPFFAKAFRVHIISVDGEEDNLLSINNAVQANIFGSQIWNFGPLFHWAEVITFDAAGGPAVVSKSTKVIPLLDNAMILQFLSTALNDIELAIEWYIYK